MVFLSMRDEQSMNEPFWMILFENKHNAWLIPFILLKHQCKSSFVQNYTKIKICVFIAVKYIKYMQFYKMDRTDRRLPGIPCSRVL